MNEEEASFSFVVVENFVKIVKRSLDPKVDLDHKSKNVREKKERKKKERDHTFCFSRMKISNTPKSNTPPFVALSLL